MGIEGPCVPEAAVSPPWNTTVMPHCSETPRGPSHSQEELALPFGLSNPPQVVGLSTSNSQVNRQELREVADLPKDTQLARLACAPLPEFTANWRTLPTLTVFLRWVH